MKTPRAMFKKSIVFLFMISLLVACSCADRPTKAMRKAEREMRRQADQAQKDYEKAKSDHFKRQAPKTKQMIREDRKRAERANRQFRRH